MSGKILFVCLGNICRSPIAEGIFAHLCKERGLEGQYLADSAGIGDWHIGQPPDPRATAAAQRHDVPLPGVCRQVRPEDFHDFDLILAMDRANRRDLNSQCPLRLRGKIRLMRDFDAGMGKSPDVPDPYYGGPSEFDAVYDILLRCCTRLLDSLEGDAAADS